MMKTCRQITLLDILSRVQDPKNYILLMRLRYQYHNKINDKYPILSTGHVTIQEEDEFWTKVYS